MVILSAVVVTMREEMTGVVGWRRVDEIPLLA